MLERIKWWMILVAALVLIGATILLFKPFSAKETMNTSKYTAISTSEFKQLQQSNKPYIVYVARPTCKYCRTFSPKLTELVVENDMKIYYYNTDEAREEDSEAMNALLKTIDISSVPTLVKSDSKQKLTIFNASDKSKATAKKMVRKK
ncbi:thioredoxin family protein [Brochothrix campestris]|nr:thioredoxin family protein [Brochothrix campestris]